MDILLDLPWNDLKLFLVVAENGSLNRAARVLRIGQPTASRKLAELEERAGTQLFKRGTTGSALTAAGERLLPIAQEMSGWAMEAGRAIAGNAEAPRGLVRIAAPPGVAADYLVPFASRLRRTHPALRLEILADVQYVNLARGDADLALRTRAPNPRELVSLFEIPMAAAVYVSTAYARTLKRGYKPKDLAWIGWAPPYEHLPPNPQLAALIPGFQPSFTSDSFLVQQRAAEEGLGAMILPRPFRTRGKLVELRMNLGAEMVAPTHLVCAKRMANVPRVRVVAEAMIKEIERWA